MALKGNWIPKENNKDVVLAEDINIIAQSVIDLEENGGGLSLLATFEMSSIAKFEGSYDLPNDIVEAVAPGLVYGDVVTGVAKFVRIHMDYWAAPFSGMYPVGYSFSEGYGVPQQSNGVTINGGSGITPTISFSDEVVEALNFNESEAKNYILYFYG